MRFLSIYTPDPSGAGKLPQQEHMAEMGKLIEEFTKAGVLVSTGALLPPSNGGARVRRCAGAIELIDGPFTETKELVAGFAILETKSRDEVIELAKRFLKAAGDGETVLHQIMEPGEAAASSTKEK